MSSIDFSAVPAPALAESKAGVAVPNKSAPIVTEDPTAKLVEAEKVNLQKQRLQQTDVSNTSLAYSVDKDTNTLHVKITRTGGETIRELTFKGFDPKVEKLPMPKGVLVDDKP